MSDLSGRLSGSQAISGSLSGGSVLRGGLSMGGGVSPELLLDKADVITDTASGSIVSIPDGMASQVLGLDVDIQPIQDLHGYDNPWPAGGGVNLFNKDASQVVIDGYIDSGIGKYNVSISGEKSILLGSFGTGTYTISKASSSRFRIGVYASVPSANESCLEYFNIPTQTVTSYTFTTTSAGYIVCFCYNGSGDTAITTLVNTMQIEKGSTASAWQPYSNICPISGRSEVSVYVEESYDPQATPKATIQLGQTVYGGTVDVTRGNLTITHQGKQMTGASSEGWNLWDGKFVAYISDIARYNATSSKKVIIADRFKSAGVNYRSSCGDGEIIKVISNNRYIACYSSEYENINSFTASLATNPMTVCYELATPVEVTLTAEELDILYGDNNIWSDTGNTEVTYRADTKLWILKKIAQALNA